MLMVVLGGELCRIEWRCKFKVTKITMIMVYKVEQIEGVGASYAAALRSVGIRTTDDLLKQCATPAGRDKVAGELGISPKLILKWTNHADLMRIKGVAGQFAELLEASGVDTIKELRHRVPANLHARLVEVNDMRNLVNRVPSVSEVDSMVQYAKEMEPCVSY